MPCSPKVPAYCLHKGTGQAVARIAGKDHYLGIYGSEASHERYELLIAQWRAGRDDRRTGGAAAHQSAVDPTTNEVLLAYLKFAEAYYRKDGRPTKEFVEMKLALRPLRKLFGRQPLRAFGPSAFKTLRQHLIDEQGLCRNVVNHRCNRIKRFVRWAVSEELAPPHMYEALRAVPGLRFGRTAARETEPIKPVPWAWVEPVLSAVSAEVAAMIWLQWLTGMRPCEAVIMRACDIDMSGEVWLYEPADHKNRWRGHRRIVALGPKAQEVIKCFLQLATQAYLFSPQVAEARRNDQRRQERKTPMTPSQRARQSVADHFKARPIHMIKFNSEKLVSLTAAARLVPKRRGRSTAVSTLYRWANRGIDGRRLETLRIGAATFTSVEALQRFFDTLTELSATPSVERPSRRDVDHELDRFGL